MTNKTSKSTRKSKYVTVNDRMQRGYRYELSEPVGRNFDPSFRPELTPSQMLYLGEARNLIERFFNKIKHYRRIATRYDKLAEMHKQPRRRLPSGFLS